MDLLVLNACVVTADGTFAISTIDLPEAIKLANGAERIDSAVSHPATAELLTSLLGVEVPVIRQMAAQKVGQQALIFKLNDRPAGVELDIAGLERIGYTFKLMTRTA